MEDDKLNAKIAWRSESGQMRILEVVIAAMIIFIAFSVSTFLTRSSDIKVVQERGDLDRLGYNVLSGMVDSGSIEITIENKEITFENATIQLQTYVQRSLPLATYFNITMIKMTANAQGWIDQTPLLSLSNAPSSAFMRSMEVSSTPTTYTSKGGNIYYIVLVLARAGEGS
jgi:hypothetical protein